MNEPQTGKFYYNKNEELDYGAEKPDFKLDKRRKTT